MLVNEFCYEDWETQDCSSINECKFCGMNTASDTPYLQCLECNVGHGFLEETNSCSEFCP